MPRGVSSLFFAVGAIAAAVGLQVVGSAGVLAGTGWAWTSWLLIGAALVLATGLGGLAEPVPMALGASLLTFLAPGLLGADVPGFVAVLAWAIYALFAAAAISLALQFVERRAAVWMGALWLVSGIAATARVIWRDPFRELRCGPYCDQNAFLVARRGEWVRIADLALSIVTVLVSIIAVRRVVTSRVSLWQRASAGMLLIAVIVVAIRGVVEPRAQPRDGADRAVQAISTVLIATALMLAAVPRLSAILVRWRVRRLAQDLARVRDLAAIREVLRTSTGDGGLLIEVVAQDGEFAPRLPDPCLTVVRRGPRTIALISHSADRRERVRAALTPTLVLALENEHLLRRAQGQLRELREARRRIVDLGDAERHRLERDLHDGAQQHLLVLGMGLASAAPSAPVQDQEVLGALAVHAARTLTELRSVGHHAALSVLDDVGLVEGLRNLAEESTTPLALRFYATEREQPRQGVNRVLYSAVRSVLESAAASSATRVLVDVWFGDPVSLGICVEGSTIARSADIEDRFGALGGTWSTTDSADGTTYEGRIPCE